MVWTFDSRVELLQAGIEWGRSPGCGGKGRLDLDQGVQEVRC